MTLTSLIRYVWFALLLTAMQVIVFRNMSLWSVGYCFVYVGALLLLPIDLGAITLMLLAFGLGLMNDMFYNTPGMHAALCVLIAFLRSTSLKLLTPAGGYEGEFEISLSYRGIRWYLFYMMPLVFIHHLGIFLLEYASLTKFHLALVKAAISTVITLAVITVSQQFLVPGRRS